jgi:hypothetical protein
VFVHSVYFWLKPTISESDLEKFKRGLDDLKSIESVRHAYTGVPAKTERPIIERGYSYGLILVFDDMKGHDLYQDHELHERFRQECGGFWSKVVIYDCES